MVRRGADRLTPLCALAATMVGTRKSVRDAMTAKIIDGTTIARAVRAEIGERAQKLLRQHGVQPGLAVIMIGDDPASAVYVRNKVRACADVGIHSQVLRFP